MKYILRPCIAIALLIFLSAAAQSGAQSTGVSKILEKLNPLLSHSSPGYLGVMVSDVDNDSATKLKLKETRGALITLIDHDAPAGQAGLRVNDVVLEINGQRVEGSEQFGRMLREIPAGHKVKLTISRDGAPQSMDVQLCDRKEMEQKVWNNLGRQGQGGSSAPALGILTGTGDAGVPGFHMPFFGSTLNVGAMVEPLTQQTADVLGVQAGILVKQVARKSEAATAGLKPHDVILKVGSETITTTADWDRALRANQDKPVQVTIFRDGKQQVLNMQVDSKHNKSELEIQDVFPGLLPDGPCELVASIDPSWAADAADQLRAEAEAFRKNFNPDDFKIDPKELEGLKQQMEQFRKEWNSGAFRIDPQEMEQFRQDMEQWRKSMPELFQFNRQQFDHLRQQMEQLRTTVGQAV